MSHCVHGEAHREWFWHFALCRERNPGCISRNKERVIGFHASFKFRYNFIVTQTL